MARLLIRVTGSRNAPLDPTLQPLIAGAESLMTLVRPRSPGQERVRRRSTGAASSARSGTSACRFWGAERPLTLLWVAVDDGIGGRAVLGANETAELGAATTPQMTELLAAVRAEIVAAADERGLPIAWPLLDAEDLSAVTFLDVWGRFEERILAASARYRADAVLDRQRAAGGASATKSSGCSSTASSASRCRSAAIRDGLDAAADRYAAELGTIGGANSDAADRAQRLDGSADYGRVMSYLERQSVLESVDVESFGDGTLSLRVAARGDRARARARARARRRVAAGRRRRRARLVDVRDRRGRCVAMSLRFLPNAICIARMLLVAPLVLCVVDGPVRRPRYSFSSSPDCPTGSTASWRSGSTGKRASAGCSIPPPTSCCSSARSPRLSYVGLVPLELTLVVVGARRRHRARGDLLSVVHRSRARRAGGDQQAEHGVPARDGVLHVDGRRVRVAAARIADGAWRGRRVHEHRERPHVRAAVERSRLARRSRRELGGAAWARNYRSRWRSTTMRASRRSSRAPTPLPSSTCAASRRRGADTVWLWGARGAGKSHLLQAACRAATAAQRRAMYVALPAASPAILADLEHVDLLAIDDMHAIAGELEWERPLFVILNAFLSRSGALLLGASAPAAQCGFAIADLASRGAGAVTYRLAPLDDDERGCGAAAARGRARACARCRGRGISAEARRARHGRAHEVARAPRSCVAERAAALDDTVHSRADSEVRAERRSDGQENPGHSLACARARASRATRAPRARATADSSADSVVFHGVARCVAP